MKTSRPKDSTWIILLRGINVGGKTLPMKELVGVLEAHGFEHVRTYIQSGNVVAEFPGEPSPELGEKVAVMIEDGRGFKPNVLLLRAGALKRAIESNPFPKAEAEPKRLHLFFLASEPTSPDMDALERVRSASERYQLDGTVFYVHAPDGFGRSKLATSAERYLGVPATARNWRTVMKLREMITA